MNTTSIALIGEEIRTIQNELQTLGPMHPGNISNQYQICGRPDCRCVAPKNPQRHGPYPKLTYVYRGRPVCRFVRAGTETTLAERLTVYKRFRSLIDRWVALSIQRGIIEFFPSSPKPSSKTRSSPKSRPRKPRS
jgi:hypothetical protein